MLPGYVVGNHHSRIILAKLNRFSFFVFRRMTVIIQYLEAARTGDSKINCWHDKVWKAHDAV